MKTESNTIVVHKHFKVLKSALLKLPRNRPWYVQLGNKWIQYSREGRYAELREIVKQYRQKGCSIDYFFFREGDKVLDWAIVSRADLEPLNFIYESVPDQILSYLIRKKGIDIINALLLKELTFSEERDSNSREFKNLVEKLKFIISIDPYSLGLLMKKKFSRKKGSQWLNKAFTVALKELKLAIWKKKPNQKHKFSNI